MIDMQGEVEDTRKEMVQLKEKHASHVAQLNAKIKSMKEMLKDEEANKDNAIREQYRDRMEEVQQIINDSQAVFSEKANVVHQLNTTIVKKVSNYERVNEMKELGKREATQEFKKILDEQANQHKLEKNNLKNQYEYLLQQKEKDFEKFVNEFKEYHSQKKEEIRAAREEIVGLYKVCKKLNTVIENVEQGVYTNGIISAYIPQKEKPKIPDRYTSKFLNKALNKTRTATASKTWQKEEDFDRISPTQIDEDLEEADTIIKDAHKRTSNHSNSEKDPDSAKIAKDSGMRKETVDQLIAERDKYKNMYQTEVKKNNNAKIVIESQKRLLERTKVETLAKKAGGYDMMRPKTQSRFI